MPHKQVLVKVNAWVDEDIAGLIAALNQIPTITTHESCQENGKRPMFVSFGCEDFDDYRPLVDTVFGLIGPRLAEAVGDGVNLRVGVNQFGRATGLLSVRPGAMPKVLTVLKRIARDVKAAP